MAKIMKFSLKLINNDRQISKTILSLLKSQVSVAFTKAKNEIVNKIKPIIRDYIKAEPEYRDLISGSLKYELGIPDAAMVDRIVEIWVNNISVQNKSVRISGNKLSGGFSINAIKSDYTDVLSSSSATITDSQTGSLVPWLEWLLLRGGDILVKDYEVQMGPNPRSRTGMAIMVSSNKNYRMPAKFAGTERNNWVYRAISKLDDTTMQNIIQNALEKYI